MKLQKKILLICSCLFLVPIVILSATLIVINSVKTKEIKKTYGIEGSVDVLGFSSNNRFDAVVGVLNDRVDHLLENESEALTRDDVMETLNQELSSRGGYLLAYEDGFCFDGSEDSAAVRAYLEQSLPVRDGQKIYYALGETQYLIGCRRPEMLDRILFLVVDVTESVPGLEDLIGVFLIITILVLLMTFAMVTTWLQNSMVKPLANLQKATKAIKEGNLDYEVEVEGSGEIGSLCRDFEDMRKRLKDTAAEQLQTEQDNRILISNISHDLKTPITAIKGYVEGIRDGVASSPEKLDKYIHTIYNKANDMDKLVDELTLYSKIDTNRIPYDFVRIPIREYFADCEADLREELEAQGIELSYLDLTEHDPTVIGDPEQLRRVINNIISNSVKYMDKQKGIINIRLREDGDFVRIELEDNGKGIAARDLPYIFDRFYRTDSSRNSRTGGSGIGLSIVKKIVEDHGGRIWAASREGFGTTMFIELRKYEEVKL